MGLIITPNTGGATYPNITDIANVVTIDPINTVINSDTIALTGTTQIQFNSTDNFFNAGNVNFVNCAAVVFENISLSTSVNIKTDLVNMGAQTGKIGFFDTGAVSVQESAIPNATPVSAHDRVNDILDVLRNYGLIKV